MPTAIQAEALGETLPRLLEEFLAEAREAVVVEDGAAIFAISREMSRARYSVSGERGKCLLHLWSAERNVVRRVLGAERHGDTLRLEVQRFGQARPSRLEICQERDRRAPSARKACRAQYQQRLQTILQRDFPGWTLERLSSAADLEHSFGPVQARGLLKRGASAFAVLGTNAEESQAAVDASVTAGVLWLEECREHFAVRGHVEGLKLVCPPGMSAMAAARLAALDQTGAKWQLFEFHEREARLAEIECADRGNVATHLVHCPDEGAARARFAVSIARVAEVAPHADAVVLAAGEIGFRIHGLEFARARMAPQESGFRMGEEIAFGIGPAETALSEETAAEFAALARRITAVRHAGGDRNHPLYRAQPERWLEAEVARAVEVIDLEVDPTSVYSQVPAFAASDRAVIDVLAATRAGRLAVIELKAEEDLQLPLQGLDYWSRVRWHQQRGEFQRFGYFPGRTLSAEPPLLYLVAPALRLHPTTDRLLRYVAPEIEVTVVGVDERWRESLRVVFRKHRKGQLG